MWVVATTTGLDLDEDGYRIQVDESDRGSLHPNGQTKIGVGPGERTVTLTGLAPNCTTEGPASRTVIVRDSPDGFLTYSAAFAVVCTATRGAIEIRTESSGSPVFWHFRATLDGAGTLRVGRGGPYYVIDVPAGDHVVALVEGPSNCSAKPASRPVTVTAGGLTRDTVAVEFSVACTPSPGPHGTVRITAPTTGSLPTSRRYEVWYEHYDPWGYGGIPELLGTLNPNGSLLVELPASTESAPDSYWHDFRLQNIPSRCRVQPDWYHELIAPEDTLDIEFAVTCQAEP
jgi:hypothetical protein